MEPIQTFNPTTRFSDVVENYVKYRPDYPAQVLECLEENFGLTRGDVVADIGSGTGIFTKHFVKAGYKTYGVEPNEQMRKYCERDLASYPNFKPVDGQAEQTELPDKYIDLITVAQAFHWFDTRIAVPEFYRILKPSGLIALVWNERKTLCNAFMDGYDNLLRQYCPDYTATDHKNYSFERIMEIFPGKKVERKKFDNYQEMDYYALEGRLKSCSYCLKPEHDQYSLLFGCLQDLFGKFQYQEKVRFEYDTILYAIKNC